MSLFMRFFIAISPASLDKHAVNSLFFKHRMKPIHRCNEAGNQNPVPALLILTRPLKEPRYMQQIKNGRCLWICIALTIPAP